MATENANLYMLSRATSSQKLFCETMTANRSGQFREHEYNMLVELVNQLMDSGVEISSFEGFAYSFSVPYISCQIDLLRIDEDKTAIDIELKSEMVPEEAILEQLRRLRNYVSTVADRVYSFTVVRDEDRLQVYVYDGELLTKGQISDIASVLRNMKAPLCNSYEELFSPSDYLVSPINSPERFLEHKYILTQQQENIRKQIVELLSENTRSVLAIRGSAGTGKTLLLYDIAYEMSKLEKVCIIHCGVNSEGQEYLQQYCTNISFPYVGSLSDYSRELSEATYLFVDEAHRLFPSTFDEIKRLSQSKKGIVYSFDPVQVLSKSEVQFNAADRIVELLTQLVFKLSNKIRTNPDIASFINRLFHFHPESSNHDYKNITILSANTLSEVRNIIDYYTSEKGFVFINYTPSTKYTSVWDNFKGFPCTHKVLGQEFDNVLVIMDEHFRFQNGVVSCSEHPNPNYLYGKMLYQAVSRTRIRLCIIVKNNSELLEWLLKIKNGIRKDGEV